MASEQDYVMEICGRWLAFTLSLHGDEVRVAAALMDAAPAPQTLLRTRDNASGWRLVTRLVGAFSRAKTQSLERPIELMAGDDPDDHWKFHQGDAREAFTGTGP